MKVKAQVFAIGCALKALLMDESYPFYSPQKYTYYGTLTNYLFIYK